MGHILFYSDVDIFGGHERMTRALVNTVARRLDARVSLLHVHPDFAVDLDPRVERARQAISSPTPLPFLRNLRPDHVVRVARALRERKPDLVVVSQGNIEFGVKGLLAARMIGVRTASYLPLAYSFAESGSNLAALRDLVDRGYYQLPDDFIMEAAYQLRLLSRFTKKPGHVIRYPITSSGLPSRRVTPPAAGRPLRIGVVGRIYYKHKNHGILPGVARQLEATGFPAVFHVVGDGPDAGRLRQDIAAAGVQSKFTLHGWVSRSEVLRLMRTEFDLLLVPSHFEGVPLVMLEAFAEGLPALFSTLEFLDDYDVPRSMRIDRHDPAQIARAVIAAAEGWDAAAYEATRRRVLNHHAPEAYEQDAVRVFSDLLSR